jgi:NAD(P)H-dependent flavin oxidoreductase YrpB (nitropropane dioxygenase family)
VGGHPGVDLIGTMVQGALASHDITILVLLSTGTGQQIVAALALGMDGVIIGTRFLVADEIWAHDAYKDCLIEARENDTALMMQRVT